MKKITFYLLATCFILSVIPTQIKASTDTETAKTAIISVETGSGSEQLSEIKSIDLTILSTSKDKEVLKTVSPLENEQGRHHGRYNNRHGHSNVDVTIQSNRGYRHRHGGAYIGGGGVIVLILILVLVL